MGLQMVSLICYHSSLLLLSLVIHLLLLLELSMERSLEVQKVSLLNNLMEPLTHK